jgi:hypothetical protein
MKSDPASSGGRTVARVVYDDGRADNDEVFFPEADDRSDGGCQGKVPDAFTYRVRVWIPFTSHFDEPNPFPSF